MSMVYVKDGLYFERLDGGDVRIIVTDGKSPEDGGKILSDHGIHENIWCSTVLNMTAFSERPNDFHRFADHHHGRRDLMETAPVHRLKP